MHPGPVSTWLHRSVPERVIVPAMLALLHLASTLGLGQLWMRGFMLVHFGLILVWQPFMRRDGVLTRAQVVVIAIVAGLVLGWFNAYLLAFWVCLLSGIVGGKVFLSTSPWRRRFYLLAFLYLVSLLVAVIVPLGVLDLSRQIPLAVTALLVLPLLVISMLPLEAQHADEPQMVDLFYAALIFMLLVSVTLATLNFMTFGGLEYLPALILSLLIFSMALIGLSLAWNSARGFSGLSMYFSRHVMSIGLPVDRWLHGLAGLYQTEAGPHTFLRKAVQRLSDLPGVTGGRYSAENMGSWPPGEADRSEVVWDNVHRGRADGFGSPTRYYTDYMSASYQMRIYFMRPRTPLLIWHFNLLGQLLEVFYLAKLREQRLQQQSYAQAMHETGSRVSHDVKNLLQVLATLTSSGTQRKSMADGLESLLLRQLPVISERLQGILAQFDNSVPFESMTAAGQWWSRLQLSHQQSEIEFEPQALITTENLPMPLFDSAAENLISNALRKREHEPGLRIRVHLDCSVPQKPCLRVIDDGSPIAPELLLELMKHPVPSRSGGNGLGLYQLTQLASAANCDLELESNRAGCVCFKLGARKTI